jgi:hypothetical protein
MTMRLGSVSAPNWLGASSGAVVVGFCIEEQELAEIGEAARRGETQTGADPIQFPLTSQAMPTILTMSADERFQLGLQLMLAL